MVNSEPCYPLLPADDRRCCACGIYVIWLIDNGIGVMQTGMGLMCLDCRDVTIQEMDEAQERELSHPFEHWIHEE